MLKKLSNFKSLAKIDVFLSPNFDHTIKNDKTVRFKKKRKMWLYQSYSELCSRFVLAWYRLLEIPFNTMYFRKWTIKPFFFCWVKYFMKKPTTCPYKFRMQKLSNFMNKFLSFFCNPDYSLIFKTQERFFFLKD